MNKTLNTPPPGTQSGPLSASQRAEAQGALRGLREALLRSAAEHRDGLSRIEAARSELERLREEDDAQSDEQRGFEQMLSSREQEELLAVDAAQARLADGLYGLCVACEAPIPWARLQAQPEAARCIGCQSKLESEAHRRA